MHFIYCSTSIVPVSCCPLKCFTWNRCFWVGGFTWNCMQVFWVESLSVACHCDCIYLSHIFVQRCEVPEISWGWQSISPSFLLGGQLSLLNFEKREIKKKNECLGGLKEFLLWIFAWGAYYVSCQKRLLKMKYGLESSISNVDLGLF